MASSTVVRQLPPGARGVLRTTPPWHSAAASWVVGNPGSTFGVFPAASQRVNVLSSASSPVLSDENVTRYVKAMLPVALLLIIVPMVDISLRSSSTDIGSLQWRFGTVGLLFGNMGTIILGLSLAGFVSVVVGRRSGLRAVGFVAVTLAIIIAALLVLFALDAVQVRRLVAIPAKRAVLTSSAGAAFSAMFGVLALVLLGRGALVASRGDRAAGPRRSRQGASPLVAQATGAPPVRPRAEEPV